MALAELPDVLAGPIVRRVEPQLVSVWIALKAPATVTLAVWRGLQTAGTAEQSVASGDLVVGIASAPARRFGQNLFVALVTITLTPARTLSPATIYSYDVQIDGRGLRSRGLLRNETLSDAERQVRAPALALGYVENRLPSFATPGDTLERTRLVQASCRNTVGPRFDALAWLDTAIEDELAHPDARPQLLFMTGDQIYADDLSAQLLHMLGGIAADLIGEEQLRVKSAPPDPTSGQGSIDTRVAGTLKNFPALRRQRTTIRLGGYTSGDGENHLLTYGEYVAMYLAVWNPRVWRALGTADQIFTLATPTEPALAPYLDEPERRLRDSQHPEQKERLTLTAADIERLKIHHAEGFRIRAERLQLFRAGVPHVARALANVASYMIFDDHDVTDDWNLSKKWVNRCYSKPFGRQIVRNAVMAYAVFQAWGNDPQAFTANRNKEILDETERLYGVANGPYPVGIATSEMQEPVDTLCGTSGAPADRQPVWSFRVPTPRAQIVVLDTRTRRKFTGQGYLTPDLIGLNRDAQIPAGPLSDGREVLVVVSPTPVFGPDVIDSFGWSIAQLAVDVKNLGEGLDGSGVQQKNVGAERYDAEGWSQNELGRELLLKRLSTYSAVVILSGDVHYSCTAVVDYYRKGAPQPSRLVQLTASPARNQFKPVVRLAVRQVPALQSPVSELAISRMGWDGPSSLVVPPEAIVSPGRRARLTRSPSMVPAGGWPTGTAIPADKPPDWRWRIKLARDVRPESAMPTVLRQPLLPASAELVETDALAAYRSVAVLHQQLAVQRYQFLRQIVFECNIGVVSFSRDAQGRAQVRHTILSENGPDAVDPTEGTVHVVSLAPSTEPPPEIGFR
jgi:hypothetical protein